MSWFRAGLYLVIVGLGLITLFCLLGGIGGPTDIFNHLWPVWMTAAIGLLVIALISRTHAAATALIIQIVILGALAMDLSPLPRSAAPRDIRIVTHNLWGSPIAAQNVVALALEVDADIVAVQEAFNHQNAELDQLRVEYPYVSRCRWESTRIYSRFPLHGPDCLRQDRELPTTPGWTAQYLEMPSSAWSVVELPDGEHFLLGSIHMTWPTPLSDQDEQIEAIARELHRLNTDNLVLVGDFNAAAPARVLEEMANRWRVSRVTRHQASWPAPLPIVGIDHAFVGENWARVAIEVGPQTGSDHRPLIIDLARAD